MLNSKPAAQMRHINQSMSHSGLDMNIYQFMEQIELIRVKCQLHIETPVYSNVVIDLPRNFQQFEKHHVCLFTILRSQAAL